MENAGIWESRYRNDITDRIIFVFERAKKKKEEASPQKNKSYPGLYSFCVVTWDSTSWTFFLHFFLHLLLFFGESGTKSRKWKYIWMRHKFRNNFFLFTWAKACHLWVCECVCRVHFSGIVWGDARIPAYAHKLRVLFRRQLSTPASHKKIFHSIFPGNTEYSFGSSEIWIRILRIYSQYFFSEKSWLHLFDCVRTYCVSNFFSLLFSVSSHRGEMENSSSSNEVHTQIGIFYGCRHEHATGETRHCFLIRPINKDKIIYVYVEFFFRKCSLSKRVHFVFHFRLENTLLLCMTW